MNYPNKNNPKNFGFTAVEIIFAIAIGGFVIAISFMAISSAQSNKRDAQRKADMAQVNQSIINWANENAGANPSNTQITSGGAFYTAYIDGKLTSPSTGSTYTIATVDTDGGFETYDCRVHQDTIVYERINERSYRIKVCLESGEFSENH